jgi:hypothetical protein
MTMRTPLQRMRRRIGVWPTAGFATRHRSRQRKLKKNAVNQYGWQSRPVAWPGFKPSRAAFQSVSMRSIVYALVVTMLQIVPLRFVDFDTFSTDSTGSNRPEAVIERLRNHGRFTLLLASRGVGLE